MERKINDERTFSLEDISFGAEDLATRVVDVALRATGGYASGELSELFGWGFGKAIGSNPSINSVIPDLVNQVFGVQSTNEIILGTSAFVFGAIYGGIRSGVRKWAEEGKTEYKLIAYPAARLTLSYVDKSEKGNE